MSVTPEPRRSAEPTPEIAIVPAGWGHLWSLYRVHVTCFPHAYPFWRFVGYRLSTHFCIRVAMVDEQVAGYVVGSVSDHLRPPTVVGEIVSLAVLPEHRRHGLGRRLLEAATLFLRHRGVPEVYLQVAVDNDPAQNLYRSAGFVTTETLHHYYIDGGDAYLMRRPVASDTSPTHRQAPPSR